MRIRRPHGKLVRYRRTYRYSKRFNHRKLYAFIKQVGKKKERKTMSASSRENFTADSLAMAAANRLTDEEFLAENDCDFVQLGAYHIVYPDPPLFDASEEFPESMISDNG